MNIQLKYTFWKGAKRLYPFTPVDQHYWSIFAHQYLISPLQINCFILLFKCYFTFCCFDFDLTGLVWYTRKDDEA